MNFDPHKPIPGLCDTCIYAYHVEGGGASAPTSWLGTHIPMDCPQRYCASKHIAIHFGGIQECEKYQKKETP